MGTFYSDNDYRAYLSHGGPGSGRYPKGSGKNPFQHVPGRKHYTQIAGKEPEKTEKPKRLKTPKATESSQPSAGSWLNPNIKAGKDRAPISAAEKTVQQSEKIVQNSADIVKAARTLKKSQPSAAKDLTDEELTAALKRLRMEAEFDRLTSNDTTDGYDKAVAILSMAGSVVGIVGGVVTILSTVQGLKK